MSGLLNLQSQKVNEHRIGYLRRLASCNGYAGWRDMVRAAGFKPKKAVVENDFSELMIALGAANHVEHPPMPMIKHHPQGVLGSFDRTKYDPVCPHCLQESEYLRHEWSHCLVVACPEHQCLLIDRYPRCHLMLENTRTGIAICDCGFDLRYATPSEATPIQCWSSARMAGDMRPVRLVDEIGAADDYLHLDDLLFQLAIRFDPHLKIKRGSAKRPQNIDDADALLRPVLEIFEDLHPRLTAHIEARFEAGDQGAFNLSQRLGAWYGALNKLCRKTRAFPIIWEIFSDVVCDHFDGLIRGEVGLTPSPGKQRQYLSLGEAAALIGVSKPILKNAILHHQIPVRSGREGPSSALYMISRQECQAALSVRQNWISRRAAAIYLGVPRGILQHLINADIVTPDEKWDQSIFKSGPFSKVQLADVLEKMTAAIEVRHTTRNQTLNQINAKLTGDINALNRLYHAILSGELKPVGRDNDAGLAGLIFASEEVNHYLGTTALDSVFTLNQVALANGWKYQTVAGWTKQGLLDSEIAVLQGTKSRVVTLEGLARFRRNWVPISEIAAAIGSKSSAVCKHLAAKGIDISGQTYEAGGAARGGLIRLTDFGRLAGLVGSISRKSIETLRGEHVH